MSNRIFSRDKAKMMYKNRMSIIEIADSFGVSKQAVYEALVKMNVRMRIKGKSDNKIKLKRIKLGLSQKELSEILGVTQCTVSKVENDRDPSPELAKKIKRHLRMSMDDIYS